MNINLVNPGLHSLMNRFSRSRLQGRVKRLIWGLLLSLSLILFPLLSQALTVQEVPNPQQEYGGWVTDMANILRESTKTQLNQMISELEATTGIELAVVTVPNTASAATPRDFTTALFEEWAIGKSEEDNGVLFLTSVGDRRVEIETGYGVEGILPDARVGNIVETQITPRFREGDWDGGVLAGTEALVSVLSGNPLETGLPEPSIPTAPVGASSMVALGLSWFGYKKAKYISRQPIALAPKGRSQVMGRFNGYPFGLYFWTVVALLSVSLAIILGGFLLDPSRRLWQGISIIFVVLIFLLILVAIWRLLYNYISAQIQESTSGFTGSKIFAVIASCLVLGMICLGFSAFFAGASMVLIAIILLPTDVNQSLGFYGFISLIVSGVFSLICAQVILSLFPLKITFTCEECSSIMTGVSEDILSDRLTKPQQVAKQLGSTRFEGWH
ncbi:MAG: TPM domain-containing protein, partial [Chroococcales cyanobacterium]